MHHSELKLSLKMRYSLLFIPASNAYLHRLLTQMFISTEILSLLKHKTWTLFIATHQNLSKYWWMTPMRPLETPRVYPAASRRNGSNRPKCTYDGLWMMIAMMMILQIFTFFQRERKRETKTTNGSIYRISIPNAIAINRKYENSWNVHYKTKNANQFVLCESITLIAFTLKL